MLPALVSLKSLIKPKSWHIDHPLFRLHYQATTCALLAFCLILTAKILFGDTIDCKSRLWGREDFSDNLCYSQGTYTMYAIDAQDIVGHVPDNLAVKNQTHATPPASLKRRSAEVSPDPEGGFLATGAGWMYGFLFPGSPGDERRIPAVDIQQAESGTTIVKHQNATHSAINHISEQKAFLGDVLTGTLTGDYLKNHFRYIHKLLKINDANFSPSVRYIYTGIMIPREDEELYSTVLWHRYYQYIPIILFLQAVFFYLPHYLWKNWESGIVSSICKQLHENRFAATEYIDSNYHLIDYLQSCFLLNKSLVYKYYLCHLLLLLNLITQIIVLNAIFNNQFITYGIDVFHYLFIDTDLYGLRSMNGNIDELNNPMDFVFPKVTCCSIETLSQVGKTLDQPEFLCVLPLNILHDKFFLILWYWFLILAIMTIIQIIFDTLYTMLPMFRKYLFKRRFGPYLREDNSHSSSLSELFLLDLIGSNSDKFAFAALMRKLNKEDWMIGNPSENQSLV